MAQARNYVFTIFGEADDEDGPRLLDSSTFPPWLSYVTYQLELCPETGRLHFQGYLECVGKKSYAQLQKIPGFETAHFEQRRGTQEQAVAYANKEDTRVDGPWTHGEAKAQGKRNDLADTQVHVKAGYSVKRLAEEHYGTMIRYGKAIKEYKRTVTEPRDWKPFVILIVGPSGTGKSRFATRLSKCFGTVYKLPMKNSGPWFDDYDNEDVLFMDEFDGNVMRPNFFNELNDRYECVVPAHGSAGHQMVSKVHIIVSNYAPKYWWRKRNEDQVKQTTRRIDLTIKLIPHRKKVLSLVPGVSSQMNLAGIF